MDVQNNPSTVANNHGEIWDISMGLLGFEWDGRNLSWYTNIPQMGRALGSYAKLGYSEFLGRGKRCRLANFYEVPSGNLT